MLTPLIYVVAFVAVVLIVQAAAGALFRSQDRVKRVNRRLTMLDSGMDREEVYATLLRRNSQPAISDARLSALYHRVEIYCGQAGLSLTPSRLLAMSGGVAIALWLVALSFAARDQHSALLNGTISLVGACVISLIGTWIWVRGLRQRRLKQIEEQLPLALDIVNRAIRAGHPVISAVQLAAEEMKDPIGTEFGLIVDEATYGIDFRDALSNFARRTGSRDANFFAVSVSIQSETGGNLAEILEGLAAVIRGRGMLGKRVKALASEGRASAVMLTVLPILLVAFQLLTHPSYYLSKVGDPIFWPTVMVTLLVYLTGWAIIHRIINFKY